MDETVALAIKVAKTLRDHGFAPATHWRSEVWNVGEETSLGILAPYPECSFSERLLSLFLGRMRRDFIGVLWLDNKPRNATLDNWLFEVHGHDSVAQAKSLAANLERLHRVSIVIKLTQERSYVESLPGDDD